MIHNSFAQLDLRSPSIVLVTPPLSSCALERSKYHSIYQFKFIRRLSSNSPNWSASSRRRCRLADLCFLSQYVSERIICGLLWWCIHFIPSFVPLAACSLFLRCSFCAGVDVIPAKWAAYESTSLLFRRNIFDWIQRIIYGSSWWFIHCIPSFLSEQLGSLFLCRRRRHFHPSQKGFGPTHRNRDFPV